MVTRLYLAIFACCLSAFSACSTATPPVRESSAPQVQEDTTLGPGDVFEVRVFGQPELTGKYRVGNDGSFEFPFIGQVQAGGTEPEAMAEDIRQRLKEGGYLNDPHVSVFVEQSNSKRISVLGAVAKPGTFPIIPGMTVIQAVSQAGGFTPLASKDATTVTRRTGSRVERFQIAVSDVTQGTKDDFPLRAGDIVFVPERVF